LLAALHLLGAFPQKGSGFQVGVLNALDLHGNGSRPFNNAAVIGPGFLIGCRESRKVVGFVSLALLYQCRRRMFGEHFCRRLVTAP
jgi:hypothetical protein